MRWAVAAPGAPIVPADAVTADELLVVDAVFDSLTAWDDDLSVRPAAAARWTADRRLRIWTFTLRADATFSDGAPVTAMDFVTAWTATARDGAAAHHLRDVAGYSALRAGRTRSLAGVRALGARTLRVRLTHPWADFPAVVAHPALGPVQGEAWQADPVAYRRRPVGNGPFALTEPWEPGGSVRVEPVTARPPAVPGSEPLERVDFVALDPTTAAVAFQQGRVDVAPLPPDALDVAGERLPASPGGYRGPGLLRGDLPSVYLLGFDVTRPPFDDVAVRRGVSQAVQRRQLVDDAFAGNARPARTVVPSLVPGGRQRTCLACAFVPRRARLAFAAAGVDRVALTFNRGAGHEPVVERVRTDLAAAGVAVDVRGLPGDRYLAALRRGPRGIYRFGWTLDYPTMDNALYPLFHSSRRPQAGGANYGGYADRRVDALLDRARATADAHKRVGLYRRVEDLVVGRDQAVVPLVTYRQRLAVNPRVDELVVGPMGTADLTAVSLAVPTEPTTP